ncbi:MAG: hypothetical protein M1823_004882 [Watsoniomyces obsoletus]|nr:MAG: hypothetical protein M1823_004882 [Watsoniomyces obsoletus]
MLVLSTFFLFSLVGLALCAEDLYKLLDIDRQASVKDIKTAYRRLSKRYHPDKNPGNDSAHQKFVQVSEAYEALSNEETRRVYDQYGHEGLEQHRRGGGSSGHHHQPHDPFDLFSRFFGGGGHFGHGGGQRRGPNMEVTVHLPLRDFYTGATREFSVEKQMICETCEGTGSHDGKIDTCTHCGGRGVVIQKHMLAPGIFQQMQTVCNACGGNGQKIRNVCKTCSGKKVVRKSTVHELKVERGVPRGARITYENEADESPDWVAGDLIVQLAELKPERGREQDEDEDEGRMDGMFFRRKDTDLYWTEVLSLREAWGMGDWERNLTHLDGHIVKLGRKRGGGGVIQPGTVEVVKGEGMPLWSEGEEDGGRKDGKKDGKFGDLIVTYTVVLPDQMDKKMETEFYDVWQKWWRKVGVKDLGKDSGRPDPGTGSKKTKKKKNGKEGGNKDEL